MSNIQLKIPDICHVIISGPVGCGKSIVMDRIDKLLKSEFGSNVVSNDLRIERNGNDMDNLEKHERDMVSKTTWVLIED